MARDRQQESGVFAGIERGESGRTQAGRRGSNALRAVRGLAWLACAGWTVLVCVSLVAMLASGKAGGAVQEAVVCALACTLLVAGYSLARAVCGVAREFEG